MEIFIDDPNGKQKITLSGKLFTIDQSEIDFDMCNIGATIVECGTYEAKLRLEVSRKEATVDKLYADMDASTRHNASMNGEKKTEAQIKNSIVGSEAYMGTLMSLHESTKNANIMRWVMTALIKKSECLLSMAYRDRQLMKVNREY